MIVLHAGVLEGEFFLWGETPEEPDSLSTKGSKSTATAATGSAGVQPLLFDAGANRLRDALKEIGFQFKTSKKYIKPMIVWLPTLINKPVPSSGLIAELPESIKTTPLAPWRVTAFRMPMEKAVEFLCLCVGKQTLGPGVIVGKDLAFWTMAMRFAGALVAKQQFLPGVTETDGTFLAQWKPVFAGPDNERLSKLAGAMPAVSAGIDPQSSLTS